MLSNCGLHQWAKLVCELMAAQLSNGASSLSAGLTQLSGASKTVRDAIGQFRTGAGSLNDGAAQLQDGLDTYASQAIGKLTELGIVPVIWDTNSHFYSRTTYKIVNESDRKVIREYSDKLKANLEAQQ